MEGAISNNVNNATEAAEGHPVCVSMSSRRAPPLEASARYWLDVMFDAPFSE